MVDPWLIAWTEGLRRQDSRNLGPTLYPIYVHGSAKRWTLGCVNSSNWPEGRRRDSRNLGPNLSCILQWPAGYGGAELRIRVVLKFKYQDARTTFNFSFSYRTCKWILKAGLLKAEFWTLKENYGSKSLYFSLFLEVRYRFRIYET